MKKLALLAVLAALFVLPLATAATPGKGNVDSSTAQSPYVYTPSQQSIDVTSGYTYLTNVSTEQSTYRWAGILGNVTGHIVLGDSNAHKMFDWVAQGVWLYATNAGSIDWTNTWSNATCANVTTAFSFLASGSDKCSNTFTNTDNFYSDATGQNVTGTIEAETNDDTGTAYWKTMAVNDGSNTIVFVSPVGTNHNGFSGQSVQYQTILPEDGTNGDTTATTYNLWVELQ